jgi:LuxR family maltose regulon positive regulatory protein
MLEPVEVETVSDVAAANDVRAVALMTLGIVELWAGAGDDAERHLTEALELARRNGRSYLEMGCLGHLAVAAGRHSPAASRELAARTLEIMGKYGWMSEPIAPIVLATMGVIDVWQGRFDEAQPWLDRAERALRPNAEPAKGLLVRYARGIHHLGQGRLAKAVAEFADAQRLHSLMV